MGGENVTLVDRDGNTISVPPEQVGGLSARGYHVEDTGEHVEHVAKDFRASEYGGVGGKIKAGLAGLARGATLGLSDVALEGISDAGHTLKMLQEENPNISTATNIAGALAPALLGDTAGLLKFTPSGITSRIGAKIAGTGTTTLGRIGTTAGAGAFEGAAQDAGSYVSDVALGNRDLSVDGFLASMNRGALYGGVAGGALSVASHGLIAARKLFPIEDVSAASVARAESEARQAVKGSVDTSKQLEGTGQEIVGKTDRETEQFLTDLSQEQKAALDRGAQVRTAEEAQIAPGRRLGDEPPPPSDLPASQLGTKAPAYAEGTAPFSLAEADARTAAREAAPVKTADDLMAAWKQKHPEGAVALDAASTQARKQRLRDWAEGFEAKTPEDETIKAYFSEPQDPMRTPVPKERLDAPKAVQTAANNAAAEAAHTAYLDATAQGTNVSKSGTELAARAQYASKRAAARALDDVYTAYAAGQPIVDIRSAVSKKLTDQLHELAAAREDMLSSLGKSEAASDLMSKLQATKAAVDAGQPLSLGQRILEGVKQPVDADAAVASALGKSKDVSADIADIAPKITRYEAAKANLTEALGQDASMDAQAHAKAYREAEARSEAANAKSTAQTAETVDAATTRDIPADKLPGGNPRLGGFKKQLGTVGAAYEALHAFGIPLPGLHAIPIVGPILSLFLKAKVLGKVLRGHGGSFGSSAEGTIAAKAAEVQNKINTAVGNILEGAAVKTAAVAPTAGAIAALGYKLFDDGKKQAPYSSKPESGDLEKLYAARLGELSTAMQPGAIDREVRARVNTTDPTLLDMIVAGETKRLQYLYNLAPKPNPPWPGQPPQSPSKQEMLDYGHVLAAFHDPAALFEKVAAGGMPRPSEVDCVANCYPALLKQAVTKLVEGMAKAKEQPSYARRVASTLLTGIPADRTLTADYATFLHPPTPPAPPIGAAAPMPKAKGHHTSSIKLGMRTMTRLDR